MSQLYYSQLTKKEKEFLCNGVGRRGWQGKVIPEFVFTHAADLHDFLYWRGCTETDRCIADLKFYDKMKLAADFKENGKKRDVITRTFYSIMAYVYYRAVSKNGGDAVIGGFNYGERKKTRSDLRKEMGDSV